LSRRLKTQSKKEKDSKFVQICGLLLRGNFGIADIIIRKIIFHNDLYKFELSFQHHLIHLNKIIELKVMAKIL
jgi:hypothetical protein